MDDRFIRSDMRSPRPAHTGAGMLLWASAHHTLPHTRQAAAVVRSPSGHILYHETFDPSSADQHQQAQGARTAAVGRLLPRFVAHRRNAGEPAQAHCHPEVWHRSSVRSSRSALAPSRGSCAAVEVPAAAGLAHVRPPVRFEMGPSELGAQGMLSPSCSTGKVKANRQEAKTESRRYVLGHPIVAL